MNTKKLSIPIIMAILIIMSSGIYAQKGQNQSEHECPHHGRFYHGHHFNKGNFLKSLDLTEDQEEKLDAMRVSHMEKMLPMKNELEEMKARLKTLSTAKNVDMNEINSQIDEMVSLKANMLKEREAHHQEVRKQLTDEQRIKFDMHRSNHDFMGEGRGRGYRNR